MDGLYDTTFNNGGAGANAYVAAVVIQGTKYIAGGNFTAYNGVSYGHILRLSSDGTPDTTFNNGGSGLDSIVLSLLIQSDGKILAGGNFTTYNGGACPDGIIRLSADGALDTGFNNGGAGANNYVRFITEQSDGKLIIGGNFTTYNGTAYGYIVRLNTDGTVDTGFNNGGSGFNSVVTCIRIQSNGKIIVGGNFTTYNGSACPGRIARLNADGTLDTTFNNGGAGLSNLVYTVVIQDDAKIICAGTGNVTYNGTSCPNPRRINSDGSLDTAYCGGYGVDASSGNMIYFLAEQSDKKIIVGGGFDGYQDNPGGGITFHNTPNGIIRIKTDGRFDTTFNTGNSGLASSTVPARGIAIHPIDQKIIAGGLFPSYNGAETPDYIIRLTNTPILSGLFFANG